MSQQQEHVHFIGIGGSGMSAVAKVLAEMGYRVSGSDVHDHDLLHQLRAQGVSVYLGHHADHVKGADYVVYSTGIPEDNIEKKMARVANIPLLHRSQMLAKLLNQRRGIAITGAHGKTTTTSLVTLMMTEAQLDPTFLIGGEVLDFGFNAKAGQSEYVVAEADESDASFLKYYPEMAIITNIEADHLENYGGDFEQLKNAYVQFIHQIKRSGVLIVGMDDPDLAQLMCRKDVQQIIKQKNITLVTYSLSDETATIRTTNLSLHNGHSQFELWWNNKSYGFVELSVPGKHNVYNALATMALGFTLDVDMAYMKRACKSFVGAKRRFQVIGDARDILVVDDYAHHPTEILATIEAAKSTGRRIVAVFQPQRYTRTYFLLDAFSYAFKEADEVIIADIYSPSGEQPLEGVTSEALVNRIKVNSNPHVQFIAGTDDIVETLTQTLQPGDLLLTMGAGDIWKVAHTISHTMSNLE
ncbi:UDP-N-acetylmuramate--L-alanine ligase [Caldalkalibacillus salinus]|uniref:UDP-N-acetylmuramate--L-alanine ligase n=1 Tax=Caldalkalibacillus salinus TaxID=2803787 RepID=UPI002351B38C|nr:UDP-N-acetylmuramate--L-alanine ligase [Caldalkalibacillus salinus]